MRSDAQKETTTVREDNGMNPSKNPVSTLWARLRSGNLTTTFALLATLSAGILAGSMFTGSVSGKEQQKIDSADARPLVIPNPVTLSNGFSGIVKQVGPAVVNINTESTPKPSPKGRGNGRKNNSPDDDNGLPDIFRFFGGGGNGEEMPEGGGTRYALGSGFIVDPRGYIITNNHVIDKADHIYVKLSTDPETDADHGRPATVIGADPDTDIAVIKIDTKTPLPTIKLGNSEGAQVGDWVLAIGSPFGLNQTVSAGIVSAKNRTIEDQSGPNGTSNSQFQKFIQTDAAINPGNSGGPLVDMAGQVIGMNTAIYTQSAGSEGVGFAMPSNTLINVYNMLIGPDHKVTRGSIGITFQAAQSSAVTRQYGSGVIIGAVTPNGPASKAGLQPFDVITSIDGQRIADGDELVAIISAKHPGQTVKLGYIRSGKTDVATVGIADRSKLFDNAASNDEDSNSPDDSDVGQNKLGITVSPTPSSVSGKIGVKGGVIVNSVRPGSFAEEINLPKGAVIVEINRKPVTDESAYKAIVTGLKPGDDVVFAVRDPRLAGGGISLVGGTLP